MADEPKIIVMGARKTNFCDVKRHIIFSRTSELQKASLHMVIGIVGLKFWL